MRHERLTEELFFKFISQRRQTLTYGYGRGVYVGDLCLPSAEFIPGYRAEGLRHRIVALLLREDGIVPEVLTQPGDAGSWSRLYSRCPCRPRHITEALASCSAEPAAHGLLRAQEIISTAETCWLGVARRRNAEFWAVRTGSAWPTPTW